MAEGCEKMGDFGYKVNLMRGEAGQWFCFEHRHLGEALYASSTSLRDDASKGETDDKSSPARDLLDGS
jgi:hypothetical protein